MWWKAYRKSGLEPGRPWITRRAGRVASRWRIALAIAGLLSVFGVANSAQAAGLGRPLPGPIVTGFSRPTQNWLPGHRGIDIQGNPGDPVASAADGEVIFVGLVAGKPVVVVSHGDRRTTYEPVTGTVPVGTQVRRGQEIGRLVLGHEGCPTLACLHLGYLEGETYLDPALDRENRVRLLPMAAGAQATERRDRRVELFAAGGLLTTPTTGPITSPFGWRSDPFSGESSYHQGVDIGAACGQPIQAALPGIVAFVGSADGYGLRVVIDHGIVGKQRLSTTYNHAEAILVTNGQRVDRGQTVARVGTTGRSTGCHLHFEVLIRGVLVNPGPLLNPPMRQ